MARSNPDQQYALILDVWAQQFPDQWPISKSAATIDEIRQVRQCGGNPMNVPRSLYSGEYIEARSCTDNHTGEELSGKIYILRRKEADV